MLQVQLLVPSIGADATVTAAMKRDEQLELELKSEVKIMDAISHQKIAMKYGNFFTCIVSKYPIKCHLMVARSLFVFEK